MTRTPHETPGRPTDDLTECIVKWMPVLCTPDDMRKMVRIACIHAAFERFQWEQRARTNATW